MKSSAKRLAGKPVADQLASELQAAIAALPTPPKLVFLRVGNDPASAYYVRSKERFATKVGIINETIVLPKGTTTSEVVARITALNNDPEVAGILLQLPVPGVDSAVALAAIAPEKDVDGLTPASAGKLWLGEPGLRPATPLGVITLLRHYNIAMEGQHAVIIGRSNLVGKPLAALLLEQNATVTIAHSRTSNLPEVARSADILIAAVGVPYMVEASWVKPGATVIDVGVSRVDGELRGDVHPDVWNVAGAVTPMPGGTGLLTVASVIANTVHAAKGQ